MPLEVVVLAAGAGTRMRSRLPKVLHCLAGRPLLSHVLDTAAQLAPRAVHVVVGEDADAVRAGLPETQQRVGWVRQTPQLGTGHAAMQALPAIADDATVLVLLGDVPLVRAETAARCARAAAGGIALVTARVADPSGFGRILRIGGAIAGIAEERDASAAERTIDEVNTGILAAPAALLRDLLASIGRDNAQSEYYLTDIVGRAHARGIGIAGIAAETPEEVMGINDRIQLAHLERHVQRRRAEALMAAGVTIADPARLDIRGSVSAAQDCAIDVGVVFEGDVRLGSGVRIGAGCVIRDSTLGDDVDVAPMSIVDGAVVAGGCRIGPFARLRPGTELGAAARIGNFVETKNARLGSGSKANHLAYLGDASVGAGCNIGAGAVTCNYDGVEKHATEIGDRVFVGTNSTLVAPLAVEDDAYIGAGSTITTRVDRGDLAIGRSRQRAIRGWTPPARRRKPEGA